MSNSSNEGTGTLLQRQKPPKHCPIKGQKLHQVSLMVSIGLLPFGLQNQAAENVPREPAEEGGSRQQGQQRKSRKIISKRTEK